MHQRNGHCQGEAMNQKSQNPKSGMGVLTLALLNIAAVLSIVNFPEQAEYGYAIIFYITAGTVCFFLPLALISAELASAWPEDGGVYLWVREAFGPRWGFVTVFLQWLNSLPWYATVLTFIATALAYILEPRLAENRVFVYCVIVGSMWLCTVLNFRGIRLYERINSIGALVGTILPGAALIGLAVFYLAGGNPPAIAWSRDAWLPDLRGLDQWMLLAGMMVALAGIDMTAVHVTDVKNPQKNYPRSILIASVLIILLSIFGSLSISLVVSPDRLSMASGAPQAFDRMLSALGLRHLVRPVCLLLICGALTTVFTWTLGPSKGLLEVAREGYLPAFWQKRNRFGIPVHILLVQATIPSLIALLVFVMSDISNAFWVMMALSAQLYMTMYLFLFAAAIKLRMSKPEVPRPYRIPGGSIGMWLVSGLGFLTSLVALLAGFIPPPEIRAKGLPHSLLYSGLLALGTGFFLVLALHLCRRKARADSGRNS